MRKHMRDVIIKVGVLATLAATAVAIQYIPSEDEEFSEDEFYEEDDDIVSQIQATNERTNFRDNLAIDMFNDPFAGKSNRPRKKGAVGFDALADAINAVAASILALKSCTIDNGQPSKPHCERIY